MNRTFRKLGSFLRGVFFAEEDPETFESAPDPKGDHTRLHVFSGTFESEADLMTYCFSPVAPNEPEQLNLDLALASVDTRYADAAYGDRVANLLADYLSLKQGHHISGLMEADNSVLLVGEDAFGGISYDLTDTPRLRYLGAETVPRAVDWGWTD